MASSTYRLTDTMTYGQTYLKRCFLLLIIGLGALTHINAQTTTTVDVQQRLQVHQGWGVSLCWWANMCGKWDDDKIDTLVDWLVSPDGLNYNVFRYNIGGGDDPKNKHCDPHHMGAKGGKGLRAEMPGFKHSAKDKDYDWQADSAQLKIMLKIRERRPDAIFEAFSNSAPYYMTYSGCCAGARDANDDNVNPKYYKAFAQYLVDICTHYKEAYGIEFVSLDPFNEPVTNYWRANGGQEGCHFSTEAQIDFIRTLHPILKASGLKTVISASDETSVGQSIKDFEAYRAAGVLDLVGQWNTHTYSGNADHKTQLSQMARSAGKRLWMSETGDGGQGIHGNLMMARRLIEDIRCLQPDVWVDWQYVEDWGDQWCLVRADFRRQTFTRVKNYYVRQHFSTFIQQGYTYISTDNPDMLAALSQTGNQLVLVIINTSRQSTPYTIHIKSFYPNTSRIVTYRTSHREDLAPVDDWRFANSTLSFTLPPLSIQTFVLYE